jgi:hypothetical protein
VFRRRGCSARVPAVQGARAPGWLQAVSTAASATRTVTLPRGAACASMAGPASTVASIVRTPTSAAATARGTREDSAARTNATWMLQASAALAVQTLTATAFAASGKVRHVSGPPPLLPHRHPVPPLLSRRLCGAVDACGVCNGGAIATDINGVCCPTALTASHVCCVSPDEGGSTVPRLPLRSDSCSLCGSKACLCSRAVRCYVGS